MYILYNYTAQWYDRNVSWKWIELKQTVYFCMKSAHKYFRVAIDFFVLDKDERMNYVLLLLLQ